MPSKPTKKKASSFESSLAELEAIVQELEEGGMPLDQLLSNYEKGMDLLATCREGLEEAKKRVEELESKSSPDANRKQNSKKSANKAKRSSSSEPSDQDDVQLL